MKVKTTVPFYDRKGLHKKNSIVEIETSAFNPLTMVEIPEAKGPVPVTEKTEEQTEEKVEEVKPVKRTRKKKV